jgi:large subunit ribosomal protein L35
MPKLKSNSGAAKRFKRTASGGYKCAHSHMSHILTKKGTKRKRKLRPTGMINAADVRAVRQMLPHSC